jgi:Arc/MetJ family transcription regulator
MMTKRLVEIDDETLNAAARELGTTTNKDTVNAALAYAAQRGARAAAQVSSAFDFWGSDVADPEIRKAARR